MAVKLLTFDAIEREVATLGSWLSPRPSNNSRYAGGIDTQDIAPRNRRKQNTLVAAYMIGPVNSKSEVKYKKRKEVFFGSSLNRKSSKVSDHVYAS